MKELWLFAENWLRSTHSGQKSEEKTCTAAQVPNVNRIEMNALASTQENIRSIDLWVLFDEINVEHGISKKHTVYFHPRLLGQASQRRGPCMPQLRIVIVIVFFFCMYVYHCAVP
jgi:hypothetical protein